eukprot:7387796-Prymnesium_polylepis.1
MVPAETPTRWDDASLDAWVSVQPPNEEGGCPTAEKEARRLQDDFISVHAVGVPRGQGRSRSCASV